MNTAAIPSKTTKIVSALMGLSVFLAPDLLAQGKIEEIVVTAQKREELLRDVPISISVISGITVDQFSVQDFEELMAFVPNLYVNDTPANNFAFIRGIGTQGNVLAFESSVALFVDGIYAGRNRAFHNPYMDLERVEVLRGPQGALFGRNTAAGAISVISRRPTDEFQASLQAEYEFEFGSYNTTGFVSGPVTDTLNMRLSARWADTQGYVENTLLDRDEPNTDEWQIRVSAEWQPSETVSGFFKVDAAQVDTVGMPFELVTGGGDPDFSKTSDDAFDPIVDESESQNVMGQFDVDLGAHVLTSITGYSAFDYLNAFNIQATGPARLVTVGEEDFTQFSQEFRLLSPKGQALEYIVGAFYSDEVSDIYRKSTTDVPFTPARPEGITERWYEQDTETWSFFAQGTWNISDRLSATFGLRYTDLTKTGDLERSFIGFAPGALNTPLSAELDESFTDPSFNLTYDVTQNIRLYVAYAEGAKGGGFNGASSNLVGDAYEFGPESAQNFEIGLKGSWESAYFNFILYNTDYEDLQRSALDLSLGATGGFVTLNAAEANSRGFEADAGWAPTDWLQLSGSLAYLDSEFTSFPNSPCPFGSPNFGTPNCSFDVSGFPLLNAPEWSGSLVADITYPLTSGMNLIGGVTVTYQDDIILQPSYNPLEIQEAYFLANARIGLAEASNGWSVAFMVKNLFNEEYSTTIYETFPLWLEDPALDRVHLPGRPRTYTFQARYNF